MNDASEKTERFLQHLEPLQGLLEAYCRRHVNDPSAVEDVLQSALGNAFRDFDLYVENTNFRAWIFRYVNLEIRYWNRRRHPAPQETSVLELSAGGSWDSRIDEQLWEQLWEAPEVVLQHCEDFVARAIAALPPTERSVLLLRAMGDFKYREIAETLEIPVGSVMGYLGRARAKLRRQLSEDCRERD